MSKISSSTKSDSAAASLKSVDSRDCDWSGIMANLLKEGERIFDKAGDTSDTKNLMVTRRLRSMQQAVRKMQRL